MQTPGWAEPPGLPCSHQVPGRAPVQAWGKLASEFMLPTPCSQTQTPVSTHWPVRALLTGCCFQDPHSDYEGKKGCSRGCCLGSQQMSDLQVTPGSPGQLGGIFCK